MQDKLIIGNHHRYSRWKLQQVTFSKRKIIKYWNIGFFSLHRRLKRVACDVIFSQLSLTHFKPMRRENTEKKTQREGSPWTISELTWLIVLCKYRTASLRVIQETVSGLLRLSVWKGWQLWVFMIKATKVWTQNKWIRYECSHIFLSLSFVKFITGKKSLPTLHILDFFALFNQWCEAKGREKEIQKRKGAILLKSKEWNWGITYSSQWQGLHTRSHEPALVNIIATDRWGALGGIWTGHEEKSHSLPPLGPSPLFLQFNSCRQYPAQAA